MASSLEDLGPLQLYTGSMTFTSFDELMSFQNVTAGNEEEPYTCTSGVQIPRDEGQLPPVTAWWTGQTALDTLTALRATGGLCPCAYRALDLCLHVASSRDLSSRHVRVRVALTSGAATSLFPPASTLLWTQRDTTHEPQAVILDTAFDGDGDTPPFTLRTLVRSFCCSNAVSLMPVNR